MKPLLAFASIFREETRYLREFVEFHKQRGVQHFYLYDNDDASEKPASQAALAPYLASGLVEIIDWPERTTDWSKCNFGQMRSQFDAVKRARADGFEWLGLVDMDEMHFPTKHSRFDEFLGEFHQAGIGGLWVYARVFGDSGRDDPPGLQIEDLTWRATDDNLVHQQVHRYVRPKHLVDRADGFDLDTGWHMVNDAQQVIVGKPRPYPATRARAVFHHYTIRSRWDWDAKTRRGIGLPKATWNHRLKLYNHNDVRDLSAYRFLPELKAALAKLETRA